MKIPLKLKTCTRSCVNTCTSTCPIFAIANFAKCNGPFSLMDILSGRPSWKSQKTLSSQVNQDFFPHFYKVKPFSDKVTSNFFDTHGSKIEHMGQSIQEWTK